METEVATVVANADWGKYIGAGLACVGMAGAAIGVGNVAARVMAATALFR